MLSPLAPLAILVVTGLVAVGSAHRLGQTTLVDHASFAQYVKTFGRTYSEGSEEWAERRALFEQRAAAVLLQNAKPGRLWTAGLNHLTDRTEHELAKLRGWSRVAEGPGASGVVAAHGPAAFLTEAVKRTEPLPQSVDWGHLDQLKTVKEQGGCGGCWAVAAASMMEARYEIAFNRTRSFSAQDLVNCVPNPKSCGGDGGCRGATVELALEYAQKKGVRSATEEPYLGRDGVCVERNSLSETGSRVGGDAGAQFGMIGWAKLPENKATPLMEAVLEGPVAISLAAEGISGYSHGIFDDCSKDAVLDHAVLLLGYGEEEETKFWSIQNSWGSLWGENGRFRVLRHSTPAGDDEYCGDDYRPGDGTACKPYPEKVRVCGMCGLLYDSAVIYFGKTPKTSATQLLLRGAKISG